jgi:hypothetical protein
MADKMDKGIKKEKVRARNERIRSQVIELYDKKRLRLDDAIKQVADTWCLEPTTIEKIYFGYGKYGNAGSMELFE